jgi:hypothetical protein
LYALLTWSAHDSASIALTVEARRCGHGADALIQGIAGGNGVLIWTKSGQGTEHGGAYPLLSRGDSTTPRGAVVSLRWMIGDIARGVTLDSGVVTIVSAGDRIGVRTRGSGLDYAAGQRVAVDASVEGVVFAADTVNCKVQLTAPPETPVVD